MKDSRDTKDDKVKKGNEDMAKNSEIVEKSKKNPENINDIKTILEKGIKRYDTALEKLSKN